jgi:uncharacterized protein (UPF0548 family)
MTSHRCLASRGDSLTYEQGEESFIVTRQPNDEITFEIVAASRPRNQLARAFPPIARRVQHAATARYLDAMKGAIAR